MKTGHQIGKFILDKRIKDGGFASVWEAHHIEMPNKPVAIKLLTVSDAASKDRFLKEAGLSARFNHPHLLRSGPARKSGSLFYQILQFVPGVSLRDLIRHKHYNGGATHPQVALAFAWRIARALAYVHRGGVIHRDVTPANILLSYSGRVKLCDFGVAHFAFDGPPNGKVWMGKPRYLAPEYLKGQCSVLVDQYCLGLVLWEMIVGHHPIKSAGGVPAILNRIGAVDIEHPEILVPGLHPEIGAVIHRMLSRNPLYRYSDMMEVVQAIDFAQLKAFRGRLSHKNLGNWCVKNLPLRGASSQCSLVPSRGDTDPPTQVEADIYTIDDPPVYDQPPALLERTV